MTLDNAFLVMTAPTVTVFYTTAVFLALLCTVLHSKGAAAHSTALYVCPVWAESHLKHITGPLD